MATRKGKKADPTPIHSDAQTDPITALLDRLRALNVDTSRLMLEIKPQVEIQVLRQLLIDAGLLTEGQYSASYAEHMTGSLRVIVQHAEEVALQRATAQRQGPAVVERPRLIVPGRN